MFTCCFASSSELMVRLLYSLPILYGMRSTGWRPCGRANRAKNRAALELFWRPSFEWAMATVPLTRKD